MKKTHTLFKPALCVGSLFLAVFAYAHDTLTISPEPLGTGTGLSVKPNLWFILDDSGSMGETYTPDYVSDYYNTSNICQTNTDDVDGTAAYKTGGGVTGCDVGDVVYHSAIFNKQYYNPAITYSPPISYATGSVVSLGNIDPTKAPLEPFKYRNPSSAVSNSTCYQQLQADDPASGSADNNLINYYCNLTTQFPRTQWCTDGTYSNCKENDNTEIAASGRPYAYPGTVGGTTRTTRRPATYGAPYYFTSSGSVTWCSSADLAMGNCTKSKWSSTFKYPRFAGNPTAVNGSASSISVTVTKAKGTTKVTKITVGSGGSMVTLYDSSSGITVSGSDSNSNRNALAVSMVSAINGVSGFEAAMVTSCSGSGTSCQPVFKITAPPGAVAAATGTSNTTYEGKSLGITKSSTDITFSTTGGGKFAGGSNYAASYSGVAFTRVDIVSSKANGYAIDPSTSKTYTTRTDCSVSATGCTYAQELQNFANWYSYYRSRMLMTKSATSLAFKDVTDTSPGIGFRVGFTVISSTTTSNSSELNIADFTEGVAGHKKSFYGKLFSVLPNSSTPLRTSLNRAGKIFQGSIYTGASDPVLYSCQQNYTFLSTDGYWNDSFSGIGNVDGGSTVAPYRDALNKSDTLADVARYYYINDLRNGLDNDVPKASGDEASGSKMWQHMKTFTMGLGVDGNLTYDAYYKSGGSADYQSILAGTTNWGDPIADTEAARIDDLWHAAVNGHGQYFSAANPTEVTDAIAATLAAAEQQTGSAAAAATSNLEPVAGDNYAYVASYTTSVWDGELESRSIDLSTGELSSAPVWSARDQLDTLAQAGGRVIYTYNFGAGAKAKLFTWANLTATEKTYFDPTQITACNPIANCPGATSENLFDFITGKPDTTTNSSYRPRSHALGDIVSSQPVYVKTPGFSYSDSGYDGYKGTSRTGMVYVGANDGYLHAFNADTGVEAWAYAPSAVLPNLWKLANPSYSHTYYVDGALTAGDVNSGGWKTILVGGMNSGGKYYYAWDVTNPSSPSLLWEFTDVDMGYTYGNPVITKLSSGTWVVLLTSGYNNATGKGYLYVLDAVSGAQLMKIGTGSGSPSSPSGLAKIVNWVDDPMVNNTTQYVYGGDLNGDMWRFDLDAGSSFLLASTGEPITTRPELAEIKYQRVVFFGTGLFLQSDDRSDASSRTIYAVKDANNTTTISGIRGASNFVEQTFSSGGSTRTLTSNTVDWDTKYGWYIPLPDAGERVNVDPKIQLGTLVMASNVPTTAAANTCTVGGYAWLNYIDFTTGSDVKNSQGQVVRSSEKLSGALAVGVNIIRLPDGKVIAITTTADNRHPVSEVPIGASSTKARRISWREITNN